MAALTTTLMEPMVVAVAVAAMEVVMTNLSQMVKTKTRFCTFWAFRKGPILACALRWK